MGEFVKVAQVDGFPDPGKQLFEVDDRLVVLVRVAGQFYCVDDVCTHDGGTLGDGELEDDCLVCPRHGAKFRVSDGAAVTMPATEPTVIHEVEVHGNDVLIRVVGE